MINSILPNLLQNIKWEYFFLFIFIAFIVFQSIMLYLLDKQHKEIRKSYEEVKSKSNQLIDELIQLVEDLMQTVKKLGG